VSDDGAWITGSFTLGAVLITGLVTAVLNAISARRERERLKAEASARTAERQRDEKRDLYVRYLSELRAYHERLVKLVGAHAARARAEAVASLGGATPESVTAELMERLAELNRMLAEFSLLASPTVWDAAEAAYTNAQIAISSAQQVKSGPTY
jgi:hypothetical protein